MCFRDGDSHGANRPPGRAPLLGLFTLPALHRNAAIPRRIHMNDGAPPETRTTAQLALAAALAVFGGLFIQNPDLPGWLVPGEGR
jgi:hypothetical protein